MKIVILSLLLLSIVVSVRPPTPYCRSAPLPSLIPVAVNSTIRFDLEDVFDGYNLNFTAPVQENIDIVQKYKITKSTFDRPFNFTTAKVKAHNRFLGLVNTGFVTQLVIGTNNDQTGLKVDIVVHIQDVPNLHCYDVDQIVTRNRSYAVIDCGTFRRGQLVENHFLYVDLQSGQKVLGGKTTDTFVNYNMLTKRNIEVIEDPFNRILYILRIITRDAVDQEHQNNTYIELFLIRDAFDPQILDVIDYTFIGQKSLSIADYQVIYGQLYILAYNKGIYEISITRDQRLRIRSFFEIKMDMYRFKVDRIGFNDDLYIAITNGNQIYTYEWDVTNPPKLIQKYGLMAGSYVEQLVCNTDFVIVTSKGDIDGKIHRKHWIFSKSTPSYTHAFNVFDAPDLGPAIMQFSGNDRTLRLFHAQNSYNIKMSLPYMQINPADVSKAGQKVEYTVTAVSTGDNGDTVTCAQKFTLLYQFPYDDSIIKTGFMDKLNFTVDSPDQQIFDLSRQFYGKNLTYNISFQVNSSILPYTYVDKIHKAIFQQIKQIKPENIVWFEMFKESTISPPIAQTSVYGLIQVVDQASKNQTKKSYTAHYIHCGINLIDHDQTHQLNCRIISSTKFSMGKIIISSQMFNPDERRLALVFDETPNTVMLYYFWTAGFGFYGNKYYSGDAWSILTGVTISKGKLFCTLENSKKIDVFNLADLKQEGMGPKIDPKPLFTLTSQIMRFFGIEYWAPVETKVSPFHDEVVFVKTKVGVMAINFNEQIMPELLFHILTDNIRYDFEVNDQNLLIIDEDRSELYHLYTPLRRSAQPYLREQIHFKFSLGQYGDISADKLFYLVGINQIVVINPYYTSSNAVYAQLHFDDIVLYIDAVNIDGRQMLFVHTMKDLLVYVIKQTPTLFIKWPAHQHDFNMSLSAYNNLTQSQPYTYGFKILLTNETEIIPTDKFNAEQIQKLGHVRVREQDGKKFNFNVTFNDTQWFQNNVFHYTINCSNCGKDKPITIQNHVQQIGELVAGRAIYDMQSTFNGIYGQQYNSYLKTWAHNDSIEYIQNIPTTQMGQVCRKIIIDDSEEYVISLCTEDQVNVYITSLISDKPFTLGPFPTEAKHVMHAKVVDDILMIVDTENDPKARNGGIYLYSLTFGDNVEMTMIDFIDNDDLRVQGFNGMAFIGSADMHDAHGIKQYRIFVTDSQTGNIFILSFELTQNRLQVVYLSKKLLNLKQMIPSYLNAPSQLKLLTLNIHYYLSYAQDKTTQYYLLLTIANWHHIELLVVVDRTDNIMQTKVLRLFERIPWTLGNYFRLKRGWEKSQFAVPYVNYDTKRQVVAIYEADMIVQPLNKTQITQINSSNDQLVEIPLVKMLGVHRVQDIFQVAFAFHSRGYNTLLFTDMDGYNITELQINQNVTLFVKNIEQPDIVNITAHNPYSNFSFTIDLKYIDEDEEQKEEIMWIVISSIGVLMIISLIIIYAKQKRNANKTKKQGFTRTENQESLITVQDKYREDYINRTSVDPESMRGTIDLGLSDSLLEKEGKDTEKEQTHFTPQADTPTPDES